MLARMRDVDPGKTFALRLSDQVVDRVRTKPENVDVDEPVNAVQPQLLRLALMQRRTQRALDRGADQSDGELGGARQESLRLMYGLVR